MVFCEICEEDVPYTLFELHTEKFHPLICGICEKRFHNIREMENHLEMAHYQLYEEY